MYDADNSKNTPHYPGKIWMKSNQSNIAGVWIDDTPANRSAVQQIEMQAAQAAAALGDRATLADFAAAYPRQQTAATFQDFLLRHQCSGRHGVTLELEARAHGLDLSGAAEHQAMTYHPPSTMATTPERPVTVRQHQRLRPHQRQSGTFHKNPLLAAEDLDSMAISGGATLEQLQEAGIVDPRMSEVEFDGRLRRLRMQPEDRLRLCAAAHEHGWFAASSPPSANGDAWGPPTTRPLTVPQAVNLEAQGKQETRQALAQLRQELDAQIALVKQVQAREAARRKQRELTGA